MGRGKSGWAAGTADGARHGAHPPAALREAELPVRERGGCARVGGAQLLPGLEDQVSDAAGGRGGDGAGGHGTVPGGEGPAGLAGGRGAGRAGGAAAAEHQPLSGEDAAPFAASERIFRGLVGFLSGSAAAGLTHEELETRLAADGRELHRQLLQDHLDLRAARETRLPQVSDASGRPRPAVEAGHQRALATVFGAVQVSRLAYRGKGLANLHSADAALNLPAERHSHGLRQLAAVEATRGSYTEAAAAIRRATGVGLGKRQLETLAARAAVDFESFYAQRAAPAAEASDALIISADGKGIVMRPDALRPATAQAAKTSATKLATRLSEGEKRNRKRMAELAAVYDLAPLPRTPADILPAGQRTDPPPPAPVAKNKWITASVVDDAARVIAAAFTEAARRDPDHARRWVALVDGNNHQIDRIRAEAKARGVTVTILVDFIHVLEYLWAPPGASTTRATRPPNAGCARKPSRCSPDRPASSPPRSGARPPAGTWTPAPAPRRTPPPTTCTASGATSTTRPPWPKAGRSPPASSKEPAGTSSATGWTSPALAGDCTEPKPFSSSEPSALTVNGPTTGAIT